jgi:thiol-disulfide isomerase/thioredoxin
MVRTRFEWTIWMVIVTLLGGAWIFISREPVTQSQGITLTEAPIVGHLAPDFTLTNPIGQSYTLTDYVDRSGPQGQPVVLNFWASWCGPCRIEMPHFQESSLKYNGRVAIIGVNQGESARTVTDFRTSLDIDYPLLVDDDNRVNQLYNVTSLPTTVFVDKDGVVREVVIGTISQAVLEDRIERLLQESG